MLLQTSKFAKIVRNDILINVKVKEEMKLLQHISIYLIFICPALFVSRAYAISYPQTQGYVSDFAGIIDALTESRITSIAREIESKTSAQIAVVTIATLEGENIEYYANELFTQWKIGQKGKDNGLLILLAVKERKVWIETGYGLEPILPDGKCGQISREIMIPYFKQGDYANGLLSGTAAVSQVIAQDAGITVSGEMRQAPIPGTRRRKPTLLSRLFSIIIFFVLALLFIRHPFLFLLFLSGPRYGGFGGGGFSGGSGGFGGFGGGMSGGGGGGGGW